MWKPWTTVWSWMWLIDLVRRTTVASWSHSASSPPLCMCSVLCSSSSEEFSRNVGMSQEWLACWLVCWVSLCCIDVPVQGRSCWSWVDWWAPALRLLSCVERRYLTTSHSHLPEHTRTRTHASDLFPSHWSQPWRTDVWTLVCKQLAKVPDWQQMNLVANLTP